MGDNNGGIKIMYGIIYKATSPTGKVYVGQTIQTLKRRQAAHLYRTKKQGWQGAFHLAISEHGFSAFTWEQIDSAETADELGKKEKYWIAYYESNNPERGYNLTEGGIVFSPSPETRRKISIAKKGRPVSEEEHRRLAEMSRNMSAESIKKMSESLKGKTPWIAGKKHTEEARHKMSVARKGKYDGERHPMYGKHHNKKTRIKISKKLKGLLTGEKAAAAKITEIVARQIKTALDNGESGISLAKKFNVSVHIISRIKLGKTWKHLQVA